MLLTQCLSWTNRETNVWTTPQNSLPLLLFSNTIKFKRNYQKQEDKKKRTRRDAGFFLKEKRQLNV